MGYPVPVIFKAVIRITIKGGCTHNCQERDWESDAETDCTHVCITLRAAKHARLSAAARNVVKARG